MLNEIFKTIISDIINGKYESKEGATYIQGWINTPLKVSDKKEALRLVRQLIREHKECDSISLIKLDFTIRQNNINLLG